MDRKTTFGGIISDARKRINLSQKELASKLIKEDKQPISPQYLNDIEHNRRNAPPDYIIEQLSQILGIAPEILYFYAGELIPEDRVIVADNEQIIDAYHAFRRKLKGEEA